MPHRILDRERAAELRDLLAVSGPAVVAVPARHRIALTEVLQQELPAAPRGLGVAAHHLDPRLLDRLEGLRPVITRSTVGPSGPVTLSVIKLSSRPDGAPPSPVVSMTASRSALGSTASTPSTAVTSSAAGTPTVKNRARLRSSGRKNSTPGPARRPVRPARPVGSTRRATPGQSVEDVADVGLVDAHSEGGGGHDHLEPSGHEVVLHLLAYRHPQSGVVRRRDRPRSRSSSA